ncbi:MAG: RES family NAD+ phosphorylase [Burkholderiaceae bacterium]
MTASVTLFRIASETRQYKATDLGGRGAAKYPGRWNHAGEYVVYAAQSRSMAVLETAAHVDSAGLPQNRFVVRLDVPAAIWKTRTTLKETGLDPAWRSIPAGKASEDIGSSWYQSGKTALLLVPSVIVPEEYVVLVNARHPSAKAITAVTERPFEFNKLFR